MQTHIIDKQRFIAYIIILMFEKILLILWTKTNNKGLWKMDKN